MFQPYQTEHINHFGPLRPKAGPGTGAIGTSARFAHAPAIRGSMASGQLAAQLFHIRGKD